MTRFERPLASLPTLDAEQFVGALFAPEQRFARTFHHYWDGVLRQNRATARLNTRIELSQAAARLVANLADPTMFTVGDDQPIGIFGYCELVAHPVGKQIAAKLAARGRLGFAHGIGMLDTLDHVDVLTTMFAAIARKAQAAGHDQVVIMTSDRELAALYQCFGMEPQLGLHDAKYFIGALDLTRCENRIRINQLASWVEQPTRALKQAA